MEVHEDVTDSTDWLGTTLACLMPVEQAFRMTDQESKLRGSWALREAIDAFCGARATILDVARSLVPQADPTEEGRTGLAATKRKASEATLQSPASGSQQSHEEPQAKRTRSSARLSKTKPAEAVVSIDQDDMTEELPASANSSDGGDSDYEPDDGLVACPICQRRMKLALINSHLDSACSSSPKKSHSTSQASSKTGSSAALFASNPSLPAPTTAPPPERLPSISYSLLNDSALRKKMAALGLATFGSRQLLEQRHKEWTTIWNANCDSARPKRRLDLLHDLDIWERTVGASTGGGIGGNISSGIIGGRGSSLTSRAIVAAKQQAAQIKDKDFDAAAWSAKHSSSFQDLIANARTSRSQQPPKDSKDASNIETANQTAAEAQQLSEHRIEEQRPTDEPQVPKSPSQVTAQSTNGSSNLCGLGDAYEKNRALTEDDLLGKSTKVSESDSLVQGRSEFELT
ncbi:E3 ubiquitin-protein ligase rad18 [Sporothrix epigloea]|uniref:Postreplication repair E3 ubiquitin-protein ligase RAD18 n=1 Tax=Sporothrix epigloea TaxID=1892477 RepID=A0ABP0E5B1_9PEZI